MIDPTKKDQLAKVDKILSPTPTVKTIPTKALEHKQQDLTPAEKLKMPARRARTRIRGVVIWLSRMWSMAVMARSMLSYTVKENPINQQYIESQLDRVNATLTDSGRAFMAASRSVYEQIYNSEAAQLARAVSAQLSLYLHRIKSCT
jgi:hypothetical protein